MGFTSIWQWIIVLAVVLILFARPGKISGLMGDFGKGLRSFKDGVKGDEDAADDVEEIEAPAPKEEKAKKKSAPAKKATEERPLKRPQRKKPLKNHK